MKRSGVPDPGVCGWDLRQFIFSEKMLCQVFRENKKMGLAFSSRLFFQGLYVSSRYKWYWSILEHGFIYWLGWISRSKAKQKHRWNETCLRFTQTHHDKNRLVIQENLQWSSIYLIYPQKKSKAPNPERLYTQTTLGCGDVFLTGHGDMLLDDGSRAMAMCQ